MTIWLVGWMEFVWVNVETSQARIACPFMSCQLVLSTTEPGDVSKNNCASCRLEHWYFQGPEGLSVKQGDFHPKTGPFQC